MHSPVPSHRQWKWWRKPGQQLLCRTQSNSSGHPRRQQRWSSTAWKLPVVHEPLQATPRHLKIALHLEIWSFLMTTEKFPTWNLSMCLDWDSSRGLSRNKNSIPGTRLHHLFLGSNNCVDSTHLTRGFSMHLLCAHSLFGSNPTTTIRNTFFSAWIFSFRVKWMYCCDRKENISPKNAHWTEAHGEMRWDETRRDLPSDVTQPWNVNDSTQKHNKLQVLFRFIASRSGAWATSIQTSRVMSAVLFSVLTLKMCSKLNMKPQFLQCQHQQMN